MAHQAPCAGPAGIDFAALQVHRLNPAAGKTRHYHAIIYIL